MYRMERHTKEGRIGLKEAEMVHGRENCSVCVEDIALEREESEE